MKEGKKSFHRSSKKVESEDAHTISGNRNHNRFEENRCKKKEEKKNVSSEVRSISISNTQRQSEKYKRARQKLQASTKRNK